MNPPAPRQPIADVMFGLLVVLVGGGLLMGLVRGLVFGFARWREPLAGPDFVLAAATTATVFLLTARLFGGPAALRPEPSRARGVTLAAMVLGTLASSAVAGIALVLLGLEGSDALVKQRNALAWMKSPGQIALGFGVIAVLAGVAEEVFFRGFVQGRFRARWGPRPAIVLTAILFGLAHFDRAHTAHALVLGLWLGFVAERAGSIWPAILGHVANNALVVLVHTSALKDSETDDLVTLLVATGIAAGCALLIVRALPRPAPAPTGVPAPAPAPAPAPVQG